MKNNIVLCLLGIALLFYPLTVREATPLSALVAVLSVILIVYSVRGKLKRIAHRAVVVPFVD